MSNRLLLRIAITTVVSLLLAGLVFAYVAHVQAVRSQQAWHLVIAAQTILSTPSVGDAHLDDILAGPNNLGRAIDLCTEAISLCPRCKEAYETRATAYESSGNVESAKRDRVMAESFDPQWPN